MDKYETGMRIQEIKKLYNAEDYASAAEIAKDIDWPKVKTWDALAMMIDVYEQLGRNEDARDMSILAYNRNLGGKKLVYRLTDLLIKLGEFSDAKELFKEYCSLAKNSPDRHILNYHLLRAQNAPDEKMIQALENYRDSEVDERYMYRLAQLYAKNGDTDKCVSLCDNIILWFKDGDYSYGAVKLKKRMGAELTPEQQKMYETAKVKEEELSKTQQLTFADQLRLKEQIGEIEMDSDGESSSTGTVIHETKPESVKSSTDEITEDAIQSSDTFKDSESKGGRKIFSFFKKAFGPEDYPDDDEDEIIQTPSFSKASDNDMEKAVSPVSDKEEIPYKEKTQKEKDIDSSEENEHTWNFAQDNDKKEENNSSITDNLKSLITEAKQKAAKSEDSEDSDDLKEHEVKLRENLTEGVRQIMDEESALRGEGEEDEQVEGQINMDEWLTEVRDLKYKNQDTKEYSRSELERMLDEKDEKSKAYDRLMEEQKLIAQKEGKPFNEEDARKKVEAQILVDAAKTDMAIRTGKATALLETENKYHYSDKSIEERILKSILDSVRAEVKKGSFIEEKPKDRLKRFETAVAGAVDTPAKKVELVPDEVPTEVLSAASLLVDYVTGNYDPKDLMRDTTPTVLSEVVSVKAPVGIVESPAKNIDTDSQKDASKAEEKVAKASPVKDKHIPTDIEDDIAQAEKELTMDELNQLMDELDAKSPKNPESEKEADEKPDKNLPENSENKEKTSEKEAPLKVDEKTKEPAKKALEEPAKKVIEEPAKKEEKESEQQKEKQKDKSAAEENKEIIPDAEDMKEDENSETQGGLFKKAKQEEIIPEEIQAELEDEEAAVVDRINSPELAADEILIRVTGKIPAITPEIEEQYAKAKEGLKKDKEKDDPYLNLHTEDIDFSDTAHIDKQTLKELIEASPEDTTDTEEIVENTTKIFGEDGSRDTTKLEAVLRDDIPQAKKEKIMSMFEEYYDFPEVNTRIEEIIASLPSEMEKDKSDSGNIIITDNGTMDMTSLAKTIAKALNMIYADNKRKPIKTNGAALNNHGIEKVLGRNSDAVLIVEDACDLSSETAQEIYDYMKNDSDRMFVIIEDYLDRMDEFLSINKNFAGTFTHRIDMRDYTPNELVEIAAEFASRKGYEVDEDGKLAIYMIVNEMNSSKEPATLDDVDDIIESGIKRARKRLKKLGYGKDPDIKAVLTNSDFKY